MLNWIKFIVVFLLVLTSVITVTVLYNAEKPFSAAKKTAIESAIAIGTTCFSRVQLKSSMEQFRL